MKHSLSNPSRFVFKTLPLFAGAFFFFGGCADRSLQRFERISKAASNNEYGKAADEVRKNKKTYGSENALLFHMDLGVLYHYSGQYDSSIAELSQAVKIEDDLFAKSVSNEALSFLTNDNTRPYRGKAYEIVLLHEFLAFDYLALGKYDDALVEAKQAQLYLEATKRKAGKDAKNAYVDDGMFRYLSAIIYQLQNQKDDAAISMYQAVKAYKNVTPGLSMPTSVGMQAATLLKASDRQEDLKELGLTTTPLAEKADGGSEIIFVGQAGRSPTLGQRVYWGTYEKDGVLVIHYNNAKGEEVTTVLPAPGLPASEVSKASRGRKTRSGTTFHIKFALPSSKAVASQTDFFTLAGEASPNPVRTEALTDLDPLLNQYLEEFHSSMLTRTVIRVVLRTFAAEETKSAVSGSNPLLNLFLNIGTDVLADQLEQADTRNWFLLPRTVQMARIPVKPGIHSFTVEAHSTNGQALASKAFDGISVKPGEKKFVFYTSLK